MSEAGLTALVRQALQQTGVPVYETRRDGPASFPCLMYHVNLWREAVRSGEKTLLTEVQFTVDGFSQNAAALHAVFADADERLRGLGLWCINCGDYADRDHSFYRRTACYRAMLGPDGEVYQ